MTPEEEAAQASAAAAEAEEAARAQAEREAQEEEKEPGGDSPEQIRARKEYRLRKKTEAELKIERERLIAAEARIETLREVTTHKEPPPIQEKRLTSAEAWQKVDVGEWTRETATEYIADTRYLENRNREKAEERAAKEILEPIADAKKEALEYVALDPRLADQTHPKWGQIIESIKFYRREDPRRTQVQAERLALREILGPIEQVRERYKMATAKPDSDPHTETRGARDTGGFHPSKKDAFPDIPAHVKEMWNKFGTTEKQRETEAKFFRERKEVAR